MMLQKCNILPVLLAIFCFSLVTGCQSETHPETARNEPSHEQPATGDLREPTAVGELPSFLGDFPAEVGRIYQEVSKHTDLIDKMPCYCGCGESVGHRSNLDCFIHRHTKDQMVWDSHATTCGVCLEIADEAIQMKKDGKSDKEIRKIIDQKYAEGYAEPTPTPEP